MFNVNAFCLKFDIDTKNFLFSKSQLRGTNLDDYSGLMTVLIGDSDSLVKPDEPCVSSFSECHYYTTSNIADSDVFDKLKKELIRHNSILANRSNDVVRLLEGTSYGI